MLRILILAYSSFAMVRALFKTIFRHRNDNILLHIYVTVIVLNNLFLFFLICSMNQKFKYIHFGHRSKIMFGPIRLDLYI